MEVIPEEELSTSPPEFLPLLLEVKALFFGWETNDAPCTAVYSL